MTRNNYCIRLQQEDACQFRERGTDYKEGPSDQAKHALRRQIEIREKENRKRVCKDAILNDAGTKW